MVDQITTKPMGLIRDLKIYVHNIPYITTFTIFVIMWYILIIPCCWEDHGWRMLRWHMIGGVTLLPYKRMGQSKQLLSPNVWGVR